MGDVLGLLVRVRRTCSFVLLIVGDPEEIVRLVWDHKSWLCKRDKDLPICLLFVFHSEDTTTYSSHRIHKIVILGGQLHLCNVQFERNYQHPERLPTPTTPHSNTVAGSSPLYEGRKIASYKSNKPLEYSWYFIILLTKYLVLSQISPVRPNQKAPGATLITPQPWWVVFETSSTIVCGSFLCYCYG